MFRFVVAVVFAAFAQDTTYYVETTGSDSASCGTQPTTPCATINQVLKNYPGSYSVSIGAGNYTPSAILIQDGSIIIFQGVGNPTITPMWYSDNFINAYAGYEFHDMMINLSTGGTTEFTTLFTENDRAGFYNINLTYSNFPNGTFVELFGGSLVINNVTVAAGRNNGYFILALSDGDSTNITITGSSFSRLAFGDVGSFLNFNCYGPANVLLNDSTFNGVNADLGFIGFWAMDNNQTITISNNIFNNINSRDPCVYLQYYRQCSVNIQNTTWSEVYSSSAAGALETVGPNDGSDNNIALNNLKFTGCVGQYGGGLVVVYSSLSLSNSVFVNNSGGVGNDVVQALDADVFGYTIVNSTSISALPKAVIWYFANNTVTDISSYLPNPSNVENIHRPAPADISVSPRINPKDTKKKKKKD